MATYQPPTEILPKFNEFVFNQANEPEYLDMLVVHKAGTETITGNKTITGNLVVSNNNTTITATGTATDGIIDLIATDPLLTGLYGQVRANAATKIELVAGGTGVLSIYPTLTYNRTDFFEIDDNSSVNHLSITPTTNTLTNTNNTLTATTQNLLTSTTGTNKLTTANTTALANLIDATALLGGNTIRTNTGENLLTSTTGTNKLTTANTSATANLIDATALLGGNTIRTTTGQNLLTSTTGTNKLTTANTTALANLILRDF